MKKLVIVSCLLSSFELIASDFVPVSLDVERNGGGVVCKTITDSSFETLPSQKKSTNSSLKTKSKIVRNKLNFLKKEISKNAVIPKKLYRSFIRLCLLGLAASNFVPVCYNVQPNNRGDVYKAITDNSFVTSLTPEKANNLLLETRAEIVNNERNFLKNKISEKDPLAKTVFIPKSLYQLFVWNLYLKDEAKKPHQKVSKYIGPWLSSFNGYEWEELWEEFMGKENPKIPDGVGFGSPNEHPKDIFKFCSGYIDDKKVQSYFWRINDNIADHLSEISPEEIGFSKNLRNITKSLLEELAPNAKIYQSKDKWEGPNRLVDELLKKDKKIFEAVADIVTKEAEAPENSYRIYRGESREGKGYVDNISYSFSDGLFAGLIRDYRTGAVINYVLNNGSVLKAVDLPKEDLLNTQVDSSEIDLPVFIPPVTSMGSILGSGEHHHPRTKSNDIVIEKGIFTEPNLSIENISWLSSKSSAVENFWNKLKLLNKNTYKYSNGRKLLNVETYQLSKSSDNEADPSAIPLISSTTMSSEKPINKDTPALYSESSSEPSVLENFWNKFKLKVDRYRSFIRNFWEDFTFVKF